MKQLWFPVRTWHTQVSVSPTALDRAGKQTSPCLQQDFAIPVFAPKWPAVDVFVVVGFFLCLFVFHIILLS